MAPSAVKFILDHIRRADEENDIGIYDPKVADLEYRINIVGETTTSAPFLFFHGKHPEHILKRLRDEIKPYEEVYGDGTEPFEDIFNEGKLIDPPTPEEYFKHELDSRIWDLWKEISYLGEPELEGPYEMAPGQWDYVVHELEYMMLHDFEGYMVLNLETIRNKVFRRISWKPWEK